MKQDEKIIKVNPCCQASVIRKAKGKRGRVRSCNHTFHKTRVRFEKGFGTRLAILRFGVIPKKVGPAMKHRTKAKSEA